MVQDGHKMAQDGFKTAPRWPKMASSCPRWPQTGPKRFQNRPKMGDMGQDGSKMGPTRLQNCFPLLFLLLSFPFLFFAFLSFSLLSFPFLCFAFLSFPTEWGGSPKLFLKNIFYFFWGGYFGHLGLFWGPLALLVPWLVLNGRGRW